MKRLFAIFLIAGALLGAGREALAQSVDCAGTLMSWSFSYPWYAQHCHCVSSDQMPVCDTAGGSGGEEKFGNFNFGRFVWLGPESGEARYTRHYGDSFAGYELETRLRWQIRAWLIARGEYPSEGSLGARLVEWFYKRLSGKTAAGGISALDGEPLSGPAGDFESLLYRLRGEVPRDLLGNSPDPLAENFVCVAGGAQAVRSIPPAYGIFYRSMSGQAEINALRIEQLPDGRAVFTDENNVHWTFRPYKTKSSGAYDYYRPPLGSPYRLALGKRGFRVETPEGDSIDFLPAPEPGVWRPGRYNSSDGSWLTYTYGPNGLTRITDMHGRYFAFERDARGLPLVVTDEQGRKTSFTYDQQGRATGVAYPDGGRKAFGYNAAGFMSSVKSGALAGENYTYDAAGRLLTSESEGGVNRLEHYYNDVASKTIITDGLGNRTEYSHVSEHGQKLVAGITDALGGKTAMSYEANFNLASATDQLGRTTKYTRNANGDPEAIIDALGSTTTIRYQIKRNYRDDYGERTDHYSRPITITDVLGRTTKLGYDSYGNLAKTEDTLGNKTSMDYDKAGHLLELRDALGSVYKYEYANGLSKTIDPIGRVIKYERDADLHVTKLTDPLGRNTTFTYDLSGNVASVTNPQNFVTKFAYGNGACPSCGGSQLSALTDPKGNTWSFNYDQYGRLTDTSNPLGQKKNYQYDKMSRVTEVKDPTGSITTFTYDALNQLTKKDIQTPVGERSVTNYTYDAVGNLLSASNASSSVSFVYDALDRVVETDQAFGGKSYTIGYAYDAAGNRIAMATPWGRYSYTYDALDRVTGIVNPQGITIAFGYDAVGRRTKKSVFKSAPELLAETAYTYDAAGQLLSIVNKAGGKVVDFTNYEYDAAGNRVKKEDRDGTIKYRYDASNRLITAEPVPMNMAEAEVFIYDRNGNRRYDRGAWDYKYDAANRLLENSTYTYTHDLNGNLTSRANKNDNSAIAYAYNPEQQLSEVTTPEHKVHYRYDPLGRRIEKAVDGNIQRYVYDNEDIIAILDGSNNPTETFTHGPGIDEPLVITKTYGKNYYYHADGLGSIKAITDDGNQTIETYTYKAYGAPTIKDYTGVILAKSVVANPYFFTAREIDSESGLYYLRHRYYDWRRGAFTQEDPIAFQGQDVNLYGYVLSNPVNYSDGIGLFVFPSDPSGLDQNIWEEYSNVPDGRKGELNGQRWFRNGEGERIRFDPNDRRGPYPHWHWENNPEGKEKWFRPGKDAPLKIPRAVIVPWWEKIPTFWGPFPVIILPPDFQPENIYKNTFCPDNSGA
ncbi:MAG: RHS repeat-associated core domain-containing protein [Elusimicrobiales bacterium]